jgi:hypothetical protein
MTADPADKGHEYGQEDSPVGASHVNLLVCPTTIVALDSGGVLMLDLARIPQGEIRQIAQNDYVTGIGFIRRPSHRLIATSIQRASPWLPTTPSWASPNP